jgi:DNA-binding transcriptional ArsR family regulator
MARAAANLDVFHAVADGTRRRLLDLLAGGERAVMDLVAAFRISQPAISQHLRVLREAGLVHARRQGRQRLYSLNPRQLKVIADWVAYYQQFWDERFENLTNYLERTRVQQPHDPPGEQPS